MKQLVRLWKRPSRDGKRFVYVLIFVDEQGKKRFESLGHVDSRKAERQRAQKERELRMGYVEPESMRLSEFLEDSLARTGDQIRESTRREYKSAMKDFIQIVGDIDFHKVALKDGEYYRQACLDRGNSPATVAKKLTEIKIILETAVKRKQLEENPLRYIKMPKNPVSEIHVYNDKECERLLSAAFAFTQNLDTRQRPRWDLVIAMALSTALRRGEIFNCLWEDIDFEEQTIKISPKKNTDMTWEWQIKDTDRRILPLTDELTQMLVNHQTQQPEGYPYVFVPPARYDFIQKELRSYGKWTYSDSRLKVINNFKRDLDLILAQAHVKEGTFHDFRRTAICNWFFGGMSEYEVMKLAGHADFKTTHKYYLLVSDNLIDRARQVTSRSIGKKLLRAGCAPHFWGKTKKADSHKKLPAKDLSNG